jgi:hypothetical protein
MDEDNFYITLPSNASMHIYPENTLAQYVTHLPNRIELGYDRWEVALTEIMYTNRFCSVINSKEDWFMLSGNEAYGNFKDKISLPGGVYKTKEELVEKINALARNNLYYKAGDPEKFIQIDRNNGSKLELLYYKGKDKNSLEIPHISQLSKSLSEKLGFNALWKKDNDEVMHPIWDTGWEDPTTKIKHILAPEHMNLKQPPTHAYVYCDIVKSNIVGDTFAPLLRIVNMTGNNGQAMTTIVFNTLYYMAVGKREFQTIEINIRDDQGELVPFDTGKLNVRLHFRRSPPSPTSV